MTELAQPVPAHHDLVVQVGADPPVPHLQQPRAGPGHLGIRRGAQVRGVEDVRLLPVAVVLHAVGGAESRAELVAQLYTETISTLTPRVVVNGNPLFDINALGYVERVVKGGVVYR